jgi:hypothetical protein
MFLIILVAFVTPLLRKKGANLWYARMLRLAHTSHVTRRLTVFSDTDSNRQPCVTMYKPFRKRRRFSAHTMKL